MGSGPSQAEYSQYSLGFYEAALNSPCLLPDVGIDKSLLQFTGADSNAVLKAYSNELATQNPDYEKTLANALRSARNVRNAVGIGAFVLSVIMDFSIGSNPNQEPGTHRMFRNVFGEEKASDVRDVMIEYVRRHQMFMNSDQSLLEEIKIQERRLGGRLTRLRNSLLYDEQMGSRGLKIWINGAFFHIQMLIHQARLTKNQKSDFVDSVKAGIGLYSQDLDNLLNKYKTYKYGTIRFVQTQPWVMDFKESHCTLVDREVNCEENHRYNGPCDNSGMTTGYLDHIFTKYEPIAGLKNHLTDIQNNINVFLNQHDTFIVPVPSESVSCLKCEPGWEQHGGKCYQFSDGRFPWETSRKQCQNSGGDLVKIDSREEQEFLEGKLRGRMRYADEKLWIGLTDSEEEGRWLWVDGSPLDNSLSFWRPGEPNDSKREDSVNGEDCVMMGEEGTSGQKGWIDKACQYLHRYMCEKAAETGRAQCVFGSS